MNHSWSFGTTHSCFGAAEDGSGAGVVFWLSPVIVGEDVLDLKFVAVRWCFFRAGDQSEEDSAVEAVAVCLGFELQNEVGPRVVRLQEARSVADGDGFVSNGELAFRSRDGVPAGQVFTVKD